MRPTALTGRLAAAVLAVLPLLTLTPRGAAQTFTWTGASNPNWKTNGNWLGGAAPTGNGGRSEEHTSELHHLVISYAVFCLKKKKKNKQTQNSCKHSKRDK